MNQTSQAIVVNIIDVVKSLYALQLQELNKKLKNIDYINIENLVTRVEKEIPTNEIPQNYSKIVSIIESIIQD